jgi:hypothetical protein
METSPSPTAVSPNRERSLLAALAVAMFGGAVIGPLSGFALYAAIYVPNPDVFLDGLVEAAISFLFAVVVGICVYLTTFSRLQRKIAPGYRRRVQLAALMAPIASVVGQSMVYSQGVLVMPDSWYLYRVVNLPVAYVIPLTLVYAFTAFVVIWADRSVADV